MQWEDAMGAFASKEQSSITQRTDVAGAGTVSWLAGHAVVTDRAPSVKYDAYWISDPFNGWDPYGQKFQTVVGVNLDWSQFSDTGKLGLWVRDPLRILTPLVSSPYQNDTTSVWSFDAAAKVLRDLDGWLTGWLPTIKGWADGVNTPDSGFQGSAAGAFKSVLVGFANELATLQTELNTPGPYWGPIEAARQTLSSGHSALWNAYAGWRAERRAWPANCLIDALSDAMQGATVKPVVANGGTTSGAVSTSLGDPTSQAFWDKIQSNAKQYWLDHVQQSLDPTAATVMSTLDQVYQSTMAALPDVRPTQLAPPTPSATGPSGPGSPNDPKQSNPGDGLTGLGPGAASGALGGGIGHGPSGDGIGALANGGPDTAESKPLVGPPVGGTMGGLGSGIGKAPLLDEHGRPVTDPATGAPIAVPVGSTIGVGGEVLGADGRPVLGTDGKPLTAPKGATVGAPEPSFTKASVPPGSTVTADGTVTGPDGKPVVDSNGNPVVVGKGTTIAKDGTILGRDGKPVPERTQLLANEEQAMLSPNSLPRPLTSSPGELTSPGQGLAGGGSRTLPTGGVPTVGGPRPFGGTPGLSARALESGAELSPRDLAVREAAQAEKAAAGEQAAMSAAEEAQLMGRQMATTGGGGMPMMPPPGGMGGAGPSGQDRQRTTWLAEDEEVWGTETGAVSGVIGR